MCIRDVPIGDCSAETEIVAEPVEQGLQTLAGGHLYLPHDPPLVSQLITPVVE